VLVGLSAYFAFHLEQDGHRSLGLCQPTPAMHLHLERTIVKLSRSSILNKPLLFIKPDDLVDGVTHLSLNSKPDKAEDVVSKRILNGQGPTLSCLRCGGKSEIGRVFDGGKSSLRWWTWEKMWMAYCICGGSWLNNRN
jgi:Mediator complex subunit 16